MSDTPSEDANPSGAAARVWVEPVGSIIVARLRGTATAEVLRECQKRIVALHRETDCDRIMYDALELERPPIDIVLTQQGFTNELKRERVKIAIVVPNTAIAYLARLAFGEANHRVFYNDIAGAAGWLTEGDASSQGRTTAER